MDPDPSQDLKNSLRIRIQTELPDPGKIRIQYQEHLKNLIKNAQFRCLVCLLCSIFPKGQVPMKISDVPVFNNLWEQCCCKRPLKICSWSFRENLRWKAESNLLLQLKSRLCFPHISVLFIPHSELSILLFLNYRTMDYGGSFYHHSGFLLSTLLCLSIFQNVGHLTTRLSHSSSIVLIVE